MSDNLTIWDALAKTDPKHTKPFNRSGGFKGTAIKPIYIIKRLTDQFGPVGIGWGMDKPEFQVVPCEGEILVYCTVSCWHGEVTNRVYGVGGDKVQTKRSSGVFCDDEAFKKAFTDAIGNAFKFLGVGADVHMGQFDDDKYVTAAKEHFAEEERKSAPLIDDAQWSELVTLVEKTNTDPRAIAEHYKITSIKELPVAQFEAVAGRLRARLTSNPEKKAA